MLFNQNAVQSVPIECPDQGIDMKFRTLPAFAALAAIAISSAAAAQEEGGEKVNMVIVYGDDACPAPGSGEITVCARKAENERFRIPEDLRLSDSPENTSWTERVESYEMVGAFGTMSCDPAGAGGFTGCTQQLIKARSEERRVGKEWG